MKSLDNLFKFRDNPKVKKFTDVLLVLLFAYVIGSLIYFVVDKQNQIMTFAAVVGFFLVSFLRKNDYLFLLAELFTIVADFFMMVYRVRIAGFSFFLVVQIIYAFYFYFRDTNRTRRNILLFIRPFVMAVVVIVVYLIAQNNFNSQTFVAMLYYPNIIMNLICAICLKDAQLVFGFLFFALSDLCIGLKAVVSKTAYKYISKAQLVAILYAISQIILMLNRHKNDYSAKIAKPY